MSVFFLASAAGLVLAAFLALAMVVAPRPDTAGRPYLALVFLQGVVLFLKDLVELSGLSPRLVTFLIYVDFLYGLPALFLFLKSSLGKAARLPLLHFIPAMVNAVFAGAVGLMGFGSIGIDGAVPRGFAFPPMAYITAVAAGETFQVGAYALASRRLFASCGEHPRMRPYRRIAWAVFGCYGCYYAIRWAGLAARLARSEGEALAPASSWVGSASVVTIVLFSIAGGLYIVSKPELIYGRGERPKYGGKPLGSAEAERIARDARRYLGSCADLDDESVQPRKLAEALGLPYHLLSRAINEHCGETIAELIREARVERAKALLDSRPRVAIIDIAFEAGFSAKSSFNAAFKAVTGLSPSEYRSRSNEAGERGCETDRRAAPPGSPPYSGKSSR